MKNFEFEYEGQKLWYSRSLACNLIIFCKFNDTSIKVLVHKRGQGCEFNKGLWNVQGGFIDFDESAKECAIRETWEEVGIKIDKTKVRFFTLDTEPRGKRQTMVASYYAIFTEDEINDWVFSTEHSEKGEVEEIAWVNINDLDNLNWVYGQDRMINKLFLTIEEKLNNI